MGGVTGGWSLYVTDSKPAFTYNYLTAERPTITAKDKLPAGPAAIRYEFAYDGGGMAKGGVSRLFVNGKLVGEGRLDKTVPLIFSADETFDVGTDTGTAVGLYPNNFKFTGRIEKLTIDLKPKLK
jgi:arylsulfatase